MGAAAMRRAGRWLLALLGAAASFAAAWWLCLFLGYSADVALALAGAAGGVFLAPLAWWAGLDRSTASEPPEDGKPIRATLSQQIGHVSSGGVVVGAGGTVTVQGGSGDPARPGSDQPDVDLSDLPISLTNKIIGRQDEIQLLQALLDDGTVSIVALTGFGGMGKSAMVEAFLASIAPGYRAAATVFGWHFYSQEERGSDVTNASRFWERALRFFHYSGEALAAETEKAHELLKLLNAQKVILILDGIESLQNPPNVDQGLLTDRALQGFLTTIARDGLQNGGLVIVTSRQPVAELNPFARARALEAGMLDQASGVELLHAHGVHGSPADLRGAATDYRGHPLSLVLLARILATDHDGDILQRFNVEMTDAPIQENVRAILDYYSHAFSEDSPELALMYLISLVRRPMRESELEELKQGSTIGQSLNQYAGRRLGRAMSSLQSYGLLIRDDSSYDTHALIRKYFAARFHSTREAEYIQANEVLFRYFSGIPTEERPSDLDGLEPLYRAVYHGCLAKQYTDALEIYWHRISRERQFYSQKTLGAFSSDLAAIVPFFPEGWDNPVSGDLSKERRAWLLGLASFLLTALGRIPEAIIPRYAEIEMFDAIGDSRMVCGDLRNLAQSLIPLGRLKEALVAGSRAVSVAEALNDSGPGGQYSEQMDVNYLHVSALVRLATILHRLGRLDEAGRLFAQAESLHGTRLDRINGFYYGLYLADTAAGISELQDIELRGEQNLAIEISRADLGGIGNAHLIIGASLARQGQSQAAISHIDQSVEILRKANRDDRLPYALLQRARFYRLRWLHTMESSDLAQCESDADELHQQASFSHMALFLADYNLLRAAILVDQEQYDKAVTLIETHIAPEIISMSYGLRLAEVDELRRRLDRLS
jgi:tetratricopeptide (TPR) repeat protein